MDGRKISGRSEAKCAKSFPLGAGGGWGWGVGVGLAAIGDRQRNQPRGATADEALRLKRKLLLRQLPLPTIATDV
jgi:hypothetical protein